MSKHIRLLRNSAVTRIVIDRQEKRNALTAAMMTTLAEAVAGCDTPVLTLEGTGEKAFCTGADIGEFATGAEALARQETALLQMIDALARCTALTLAIPKGRTLGAGGILTTLCDVTLARSDMQLGFPEIGFRMFPVIVHAVLLERLSPALAWQLCAGGATLSAEAARDLGLVTRVLPQAGFDASVAREITWHCERAEVFSLVRPVARVVDPDRLAARLADAAPLMLRNRDLPGVAEAIASALKPPASVAEPNPSSQRQT
ncbi:MAG: enoyl-CoA hydratase/isomerase family protein [Pararhodobacter sp.]|nr:enoyl-CoA hydratase/isomerase family protein [Pararhodobacter sp.]